jgi:DNA-binding transcriptional LysR family regulator
MHMDWNDFRFLLAVARSGTLSAAAKDLRVEHTTVSRRLKRLEARLGRPVFVLDRSGYRLTAYGAEVMRRAEAMDEHARSIADSAQESESLAGPIRLTTARALASGYLFPRILGFCRSHPEIELTVLAESRILSLALRDADIAVRLGRPEDSELIGSHVADIEYAYFCSAEIAERIRAGAPVAFVDYEFGSDGGETGWIARQNPQARFAFRSNSQWLQAEAVRAGVGVGLLPKYFAAGLIRLPWAPLPPNREIWLMTRKELADVPRIRLLLDTLARRFRADRAIFQSD